MKKAFSAIFLLFGLVFLSGCGSTDITLLNEVKRFEPEWTRLSSTVTTTRANLRLTDQYDEHLRELDPHLNSAGDLGNLRSQYRNMMVERDSLSARFERELTQFEGEVTSFNEWVNDLMQDNVDEENARVQFDQYRRKYQALNEVMNDLYSRVVKNIALHNSLTRQMSAAVSLYGNYEIVAR